MIIEDKITVKQILKDNYNKFKNKYWFQVLKNMREHIDDEINKSLRCSDIKYGFAEYRIIKYENNRISIVKKIRLINY